MEESKESLFRSSKLMENEDALVSSVVGETGKGYLERDKGIKKEEDVGIIEFRCIKNNKTEENMKYLIDLK